MTYSLSFDIDPALYARAVTTPIDGTPRTGPRVALRNMAAAVLFPASLVCLALAFFNRDAILPVLVGGLWGAALVLGAWWWRHRTLLRHHSQYNDTGGRQTLEINADAITAGRPHITSQIGWPFVRAIRQIDGATLIELPTARLIVPDAALPSGTAAEAFAADLTRWMEAAT